MPREEMLIRNIDYYKTWEKFINTGEIQKGVLSKEVEQSWLRSKEYKIDPYKLTFEKNLTENQIKEKKKSLKDFLDISQPFMEALYQIVEKSNLFIRLTDGQGNIIVSNASQKTIEKYKKLTFKPGMNMREENVGTNAIGIALVTKMPIQVYGSQHYCKLFHNWGTSACPIIDHNGKIIGVLSLTGLLQRVHPHTLGMVIASVKAIENEMKLKKTRNKLLLTNRRLQGIMESISEGLISTDKYGNITDVNLMARDILKVSEKDLINKNIESFISNSNKDKIRQVLNGRKYLHEEEIAFKIKRKQTNCIVSISSINNPVDYESEGLVINFRESKEVHNLVNKIVGSEARFTFEDILGNDEKMLVALKSAKLASQNDATILLEGESGTGKELFAQSIHNASRRKNKPFIFLNCGAIPRELVGSELFGYVEGAFTGARRGGHPGKFELSDGGTIFLDEIGDMPLDIQANLLRVLETKQVVRIGGHDVIPIDVRVIAATHKDLNKEVELGNFRQDLYYRLNVIPINIPPLRDRKRDIPILTDRFVEKISVSMKKRIKGISDDFYSYMQSYSWPGNVRELNNLIHQVINVAHSGEELSIKHLPKHIRPNKELESIGINREDLTLKEIEQIAIKYTINKANGNFSKAAKMLGISRSSLYRKMEEYKISE